MNSLLEEEDDIVDLLEVVAPGKSAKTGAGESDEAGFSDDLEAMLDEVSAKEAQKNTGGDSVFPDPTPVDHVVDADEELAMPGLGDVDSLLKTLGAGEAAKPAAASSGIAADAGDAAPLGAASRPAPLAPKDTKAPAVPVDLDDLPIPPRKTADSETRPAPAAQAASEKAPAVPMDLDDLPIGMTAPAAKAPAVPMDLEDLPLGAAAPAPQSPSDPFEAAQAAEAARRPSPEAVAPPPAGDKDPAPFETAHNLFSAEVEAEPEPDPFMSGLDNLLNDILSTAPISGRTAPAAAATPPPAPIAAPVPPPAPIVAPTAAAAPEATSVPPTAPAPPKGQPHFGHPDFDEFEEEFRDELDALQSGIAELKLGQDELARRIPIVPHDKIDDLLLRLDELEVFTKDQTFRLDTLKTEAAEKTADLDRRLKEALQRNDSLSKDMKGLRTDDLQPRLASLEQSIQEQIKRIDSIKAELTERAATLKQRVEDAGRRSDSLGKELEDLRANGNGKLQQRLDLLEQTTKEQAARIEVIKAEAAGTNRRLEEALKRNESLSGELQNLRGGDELQQRLDVLESSTLEQAARIDAIKGETADRVADLDKRLEEALRRSDALSGRLESLSPDDSLRQRLETLEQSTLEQVGLFENLKSETAAKAEDVNRRLEEALQRNNALSGELEGLRADDSLRQRLEALELSGLEQAELIESIKNEAAAKADELNRRLEEALQRNETLSNSLDGLRPDDSVQPRLEALEQAGLEQAELIESVKAEAAAKADELNRRLEEALQRNETLSNSLDGLRPDDSLQPRLDALEQASLEQGELIESVKAEAAAEAGELRRRLEEALQRNETLSNSLDGLRPDDSLRPRLEILEQSGREQAELIESVKAEAAARAEELRLRLEEALQRNDILGSELEKLRGGEELSQRLDSIEESTLEQAGEIDSLKAETAGKIDELNRRLEESRQRNDSLNGELESLRANDELLQRLEALEQFSREQAEYHELARAEAADQIAGLNRLLEESGRRNEALSKELKDLRTNDGLQLRLEEVEESSREQAEKIDSVRGDVAEKARNLRRLLDESRQRNDVLNKEVRDLRAHVADLQMNMERLAAEAAAQVIREEIASLLGEQDM